ncbi:NAD-dependent epimerase/dehydratase family protein [Pseudonocardia acaciae]|uniref:NAD-dependent epimerase/dehydratase family protein n=1 Tax=Pseudonocardia acaciae TaxID=551276 RepID=UPI0004915DA6|nr:NAD-dependent epimerase/dehydratase family protein [Pseudonocardia acaciae]
MAEGESGRLLVLGGSWFLGRAAVTEALARGWSVTTFRRGRSGADIPGVELIRGDRTDTGDLARLASAGPWDLVIDTSGYVPREQGEVARALKPVAERFVFVSSVSVYARWPLEPLTEASEVLECPPDAGPDFGYDGDPGPSVYGFTKAGCEQAVLEVFGADRTVILRPGVMLGPYEYVDRLPWWLRRMSRGGRVLAPGSPDKEIQPVDVRDVATFALAAPSGVFNVTGTSVSTGDFLGRCREVAGPSAELVWVTDDRWLIDQGVRQWTELPLWRTHAGAWSVDSSAAIAAGLRTLGYGRTIADTWAWMQAGGVGVGDDGRGVERRLGPAKEAAILGTWAARELDHCG